MRSVLLVVWGTVAKVLFNLIVSNFLGQLQRPQHFVRCAMPFAIFAKTFRAVYQGPVIRLVSGGSPEVETADQMLGKENQLERIETVP